MDVVRTTTRVVTKAALITAAVTERVTAAVLRCADDVDRGLRTSSQGAQAHKPRDSP